MSDEYDEFDIAVLQEAWTFLQTDNLEFALKLERAVNRGMTADQLKQRFLRLAGEHRSPKAIRIENAARYLYATK